MTNEFYWRLSHGPNNPERIEEIREWLFERTHNKAPDQWWTAPDEQRVFDLLVEIARLKALPVIQTCSQCKYVWGEGSAGHSCNHPSVEGACVDAKTSPPSWCPLRGK